MAPLTEQCRRLLEAPLGVPNARKRIGDALWLYVALAVAGDRRGLAIRHARKLAEALAVPDEQVEEWLPRLSAAGLIDVLSPSPYLVIRLRAWSGHAAAVAENGNENSSNSSSVHMEVPVSSSSAAAAAAFNHKPEVGGAGEGGEALLREVLEELDGADPVEFRRILQQHPADLIRSALARVRATPPTQIRKSKAALFRYLLTKLA